MKNALALSMLTLKLNSELLRIPESGTWTLLKITVLGFNYLTEPANNPRTKYFCSEKKTTNGIAIVINAPADNWV